MGQIRRQGSFRAGDRVGVAVSGGIDSVALVRLLLELHRELGIVLSVVHFNHKLRATESDTDQEFVTTLAREHGLEIYSDCDDVAAHAAQERISLETAAREFRYAFFRHLLGEDSDEENPPHLDKIATGHTLDDQAETVLMRLIRGTGLRGLGGIYPRLLVGDGGEETSSEIIRPLLGVRRRELEQYLRDLQQPWREDSTNANARFTRNRVRKLVLPLLEREFNPAVAEGLAELAEIARGEEDYWANEVSGWLGTTVRWFAPEWARGLHAEAVGGQSLVQITPQDSDLSREMKEFKELKQLKETRSLALNASVSRMWLLAEPVAAQRRLMKAIGEYAGIPLDFKHVEEILRCASDEAVGKEVSLPLGWKVVRESDALVFRAPDFSRQESIRQDYEYDLSIPGRATVPEAGTVIEALRIRPESEVSGYNLQHLLDAELLGGQLVVRNWRPGDRFWPAHTKSPKKIKELMQEQHVARTERRVWPVLVNANEIVWVRGFPASSRLRARPGREAVLIQETPLEDRGAAI